MLHNRRRRTSVGTSERSDSMTQRTPWTRHSLTVIEACQGNAYLAIQFSPQRGVGAYAHHAYEHDNQKRAIRYQHQGYVDFLIGSVNKSTVVGQRIPHRVSLVYSVSERISSVVGEKWVGPCSFLFFRSKLTSKYVPRVPFENDRPTKTQATSTSHIEITRAQTIM